VGVFAEYFILCALAVSAISLTVARTKITMQARDWALDRSPMLGHLLGCPYCLSHWAAFFVAFTFPYQGLVHFVILTFGLIGASAIITALVVHFLLKQENEIEYLREKLTESRDMIQSLLPNED
jgi:hypothetical protein